MLVRQPIQLRDVLLQYERLWNADGETYVRALERLWGSLERSTQDAAVGVHIGAQFNPRQAMHAEMILSSPTVRDAIERGIAHFNAANPHSTLASEPRRLGTALVVRHRRLPGTVRQDTEFRLSLLASLARWFDPEQRPPLAVRLRAPRPPYDTELQAAFGCTVAYAQDEDSVVIAAQTLDTRIWGSEHAAQRLRTLNALPAAPPRPPGSLKERVAAAIREGLSTGRGGKKHVAPELGVSPRSVERWLAEISLSYRAILEEVRLERCLELLQLEGLPSRELASLLGFSSFSNFRRAFCRWFLPERNDSVERALADGSACPMSSPLDSWISAYGPRPCPFVSRKCDSDCTIHPTSFERLHEAGSL